MVYTIMASAFPEVEKVFNRYAKKARTQNLHCELNVLSTYVKEVPVYDVDHTTQTQYKVGTTAIDVMDIELIYPEYKLGNFEVIAVIEHGENNANMVYPCGDFEIPTKYFNGKGVCEHCNTNHMRVKTVLLKDMTDDTLKQVGTGCLKEYTGVTEYTLVNSYKALDSIINDSMADRGVYGIPEKHYVPTLDYLARCIHVYNKHGYTKDNKNMANKVKEYEITEGEYEEARNVITFFTECDLVTDAFFNDTKIAVTNEYCKPISGFIAYAYVLYMKEKERLEKLAKRQAECENTTYYGEVGTKIKNMEVTGRCVGSYDTFYDYVYIYRFVDKDGHIFIWKTSKVIDTVDGVFTGTLNGTIKEHNEYNGERQTVVTRCKTVANPA